MYPQFPSLPSPTPIDLILETMCIEKGIISVFYDKICSLRRSSLTSIKTQWEEDLLEDISDKLGKHFIQGAFLICVCQTRLDPMQNTSSYSLGLGHLPQTLQKQSC